MKVHRQGEYSNHALYGRVILGRDLTYDEEKVTCRTCIALIRLASKKDPIEKGE